MAIVGPTGICYNTILGPTGVGVYWPPQINKIWRKPIGNFITITCPTGYMGLNIARKVTNNVVASAEPLVVHNGNTTLQQNVVLKGPDRNPSIQAILPPTGTIQPFTVSAIQNGYYLFDGDTIQVIADISPTYGWVPDKSSTTLTITNITNNSKATSTSIWYYNTATNQIVRNYALSVNSQSFNFLKLVRQVTVTLENKQNHPTDSFMAPIKYTSQGQTKTLNWVPALGPETIKCDANTTLEVRWWYMPESYYWDYHDSQQSETWYHNATQPHTIFLNTHDGYLWLY